MRTGRGEPIISDADWDAIFFGFDDIYRFQHRMLQELEAEWNSQLAVAAAEKLQPPEGVCYKQRPTVRTWPARYRRQSMSLLPSFHSSYSHQCCTETFLIALSRYVRIEGRAFNV